MNWKSILIVAVFVLAVTGAYFGLSRLSVIDVGETEMYSDISCNEPVDCYNYFLNNGVSKTVLDAQLDEENAAFICESNICGVKR